VSHGCRIIVSLLALRDLASLVLFLNCPLAFVPSVLTEELEQQNLREEDGIPYLVADCIAEVERRGMNCVGIYRLSGNSASVQKLKQAFIEQIHLQLDQTEWANEDIGIIAGALKLYLRELPTPLTTYEHYDSLISAVHVAEYNDRLMCIKEIVNRFPPTYYITLRFLMHHLARVAEFADTNKMDCSNLAIVFSPTLMRSRDPTAHIVNMGYQSAVIESMISQATWMFDGFD
jgi:Rho-type GTPase-activating protein 1/2